MSLGRGITDELHAAPDLNWARSLSSIVDRWSRDTPDRKQARSQRREREILRAALRVFARDGISRARIGDIASEAGMPISSLYDYFPSKQHLAYAVPMEHLAQFFREYQAAAVKPQTFRKRLRLYLWLAGDYARRNPEWARTLYLEIWPSVLVGETSLRHAIDDFVRIAIGILQAGERAGEWRVARPFETASILIGSVNQVIIVWLLYRKPRNLMRAIESVSSRSMALLDER